MIPIIVGGAIFLRDSKEKLMTRIVYSEAGTQSQLEREAIAKSIINRVKSSKYPGNVKDVVYQNKAFSCIGSDNWKESKFTRFRNDYEEKVYQDCRKAVKDILGGKRLGIPNENEIIAFYSGQSKPKGNYWNSLDKGYRINNGMTFCAPKD